VNFENFYTYLSTEKRCSPHTLLAYTGDLAQFSEFCDAQFSVTSLNEVTQPLVRSWLVEMMSQHYEVATIHRRLSALRSCFRFLQREGIVKANPAKGLSKPKIPKRLPQFVEEKNILRLYEQMDQSVTTDFVEARDHLILSLFYETGMRRAEMLNMKDADVDFFADQVKVTGKRNKTRLVPVTRQMIERISRYIHLRSAKVTEESAYLLVDQDGKKIKENVLYSTVRKYLSAITTIKKKSPHVLRHTFATHMLNNGADLNVIKEILGHSSLAATQIYTHNSIEKLKRIHNQMHPRNTV